MEASGGLEMGENVAIVGSRNWPDHEMVRDYINSLDDDDIVVSGGARGVDQWAQIYAEKRGLATLIFPADWKTHGRKAGLLRNRDIVNACDRLVAFWFEESRGTRHSIELARGAGKPTLVLNTPERPEA
jgi:hypothetical protein